MLEFLKKALPWLLAAALFTFGYNIGYGKADTKWQEEVHNAYVKKDEARRDTQRELAEISDKYQADIAGLEGSTDRIITDLNRDNKRLRVKVKPTSIPSGPDGRCLIDGAVELHETTSRNLIELTTKADLKEKALQDTIRKLKGE